MVRRRFKNFIGEFLEEIKTLSRKEMTAKVITKRGEIQKKVRVIQEDGLGFEFQEMLRYYRELKALEYFLIHGEPPESAHPKAIQKFEWITELLIKRGEMDEGVRSFFQE